MNPFLNPSDLEPLTEPTEEEIAAFRRLNPDHAAKVFGPVAYDNGVPADGLSGVGL